MLKTRRTLLAFLIAPLLTSAYAAADVSVIANLGPETSFSQQQIRNLYLGTMKFEQVELLDQASGTTKNDFYEKFLGKSEIQMKQQWSVLVFSGNRAPRVLQDDAAVLEYILHHPKTIGYVSSQSLSQWQTKHKSDGESAPPTIFTIR